MDRCGDNVEAEVTRMHRGGGPPPAGKALAYRQNTLVAAPKPLLGGKRLTTELVIGWENHPACVVEDITALVCERELEPPPLAN
jgi:hypothetical protein